MYSFHFELHHWPLLASVWCVLTAIITFLVSVVEEHVYVFLPFISDTAALPPESCIFSQLLNVESVILGTTLYIRYRQIDLDISLGRIDLQKKWNTIGAWLATFTCLGISIVGNFQETFFFVLHMVGAFMTFVGGTLYCIVQTRISYAKKPKTNITTPNYINSKNLLHLRTLITLSLVPFLFSTIMFGVFAAKEFKGKSILRWNEEDGGYYQRLVAVVSEWIVFYLLLLYVYTFTEEFKALKFEEIKFSRRISNVMNGHVKIQ